jgi:hypothetical protein
MTSMFQVVTHWSGFVGSPGFTNLFFEHADPPSSQSQAAVDNVRAFWNAAKGLLPVVVSLQVDPQVKVIEDTTGELVDILTVGTTPAPVVGTMAGAYSAPSGGVVDWNTTTVHGGKRIRGRTFLVPFGNATYQADGSIQDAFVSALDTAATALRTATGPTFGIWSRPRLADSTHVPPITARAGLFAPATGNHVPDKACVLRSRRD